MTGINADAIRRQLKARIDHELSITLPRLHGLVSLLEQSGRDILESEGLAELDEVLQKLWRSRDISAEVNFRGRTEVR